MIAPTFNYLQTRAPLSYQNDNLARLNFPAFDFPTFGTDSAPIDYTMPEIGQNDTAPIQAQTIVDWKALCVPIFGLAPCASVNGENSIFGNVTGIIKNGFVALLAVVLIAMGIYLLKESAVH